MIRLAVWTPLPPSPSGIADYAAETLPHLARAFEVVAVTEDPGGVDAALRGAVPVCAAAEAPAADLDLYHLGNSPAHGFVYRAARARPGVVVLHDWSLHHLVLHETVERGDVSSYLREMRRAYGETGTFVGRQVARALGGDLLPALFPLNERVLEGSLGIVALSAQTAARVAQRLPGRPRLHLPHHLSLPIEPPPSRAESRESLGLPAGAFVVTAPGLATAAKRLEAAVRVVARIRADHPETLLVVAGAVDPSLPLTTWAEAAGLGEGLRVTGRLGLADFERHLAAADVVLALRFPSHGEMSGAVVRALGVGRPVLVSAGSAAAEEFPEGVVAPVDPGPAEEAEMEALLRHLLASGRLREEMGALARDHVARRHRLEDTVAALAGFLRAVEKGKAQALEALRADRAEEGGLLGYFMEEVRWGARDLGLADVRLGLEGLLAPLAGGGR
ncbi:MAG TPA: glycosyltransferase family 4 protein [Vicinamibacteria bacterium]|nr:glycosyltransferase family 4 protein [Vicinamibacteria bacterium]